MTAYGFFQNYVNGSGHDGYQFTKGGVVGFLLIQYILLKRIYSRKMLVFDLKGWRH